jgi:hypothetical protein
MTRPNDPPVEMRRLWLDADTADRLLAGRIHPDDAPPGYSEAARVFRAATTAVDHEELLHEAEHVALATALMQQPSFASTQPERRARKKRSRTRLKLGGLIVVGAVMGSTGLAAAGALPDAAQDAFSRVLDTVGITVPASGDHPASSGKEISEIATTTEVTGVDKGAEISSAASGGMSQAGQHGSASAASGGMSQARQHGSASAATHGEGAGAPPIPLPNEGGTGTADTASHNASEHGTNTADAKSEGHSSSGSGNASVPQEVPVGPPGP